MTIPTPACLGVILRKCDRTLAFVQLDKERLLEVYRRRDPNATLADVERRYMAVEDEHLFGLSLAMNATDLYAAVKRIEEAGCIRGTDFVITSSPAQVVDNPLPTWLSVQMTPVSFSQQQLEAMQPHFRKLAETQPPTMTAFYSLAPDSMPSV